MKTIYAIGDIHGDLVQLEEAHRRIARDLAAQGVADYEVVHVGDLVDRREDSCGVINFLMAGIARGEPWIALKGNHDRLFQKFLDNPVRKDPVLRPDYTWLHVRMGGRDTLASYGVAYSDDISDLHARALKAVPAEHRRFLRELPLFHEAGNYLFVHAGIRPGIPLSDQTEDDLIWIRDEFLEFEGKHPWIVVHGHTPADEVEHQGNRLNIDTGAAWGHRLSTVVIEGDDVMLLTAEGRAGLARL